MEELQIPFTLEQEANYRKMIASYFEHPDNRQFKPQAGVLTNMVIYEMIKWVSNFDENDDADVNYYDEYPELIANLAEFSFLSCHVYDWLEEPTLEPIRSEIHRREQLLTGEVSDSVSLLPSDLDAVRFKSKVIHQEGLDPDRMLTEEEMSAVFEESMQHYADRYGMPVEDFKQMIGIVNTKNRRKKPKGFGKK